MTDRCRALSAVLAATLSFLALACSSGSGGTTGSGGHSSTSGSHGGSGGGQGGTGGGDAGPAMDAGGDAAPSCTLDPGPGASACDMCEAQKCCHTATADKQKSDVWTKSTLKVCAENACATECSLTVPMCGGITPDPASCVDALDAKCCAQVTACGQSDACVAVIYLCIDDQNNDPGSPGFDTCAAQYPGGLAVFNTLNDCFSTVTCP
jgi:hypothetical protein